MKYPWIYIPSWMSEDETYIWRNSIINNLEFSRPIVQVYSKRFLVPRLTSFIADQPIKYRYSGMDHIAKIWPKWFMPLVQSLNRYCQTNFNGCLINLYRDGNDRMGWHSDNEKELDNEKSIASLSFGASRELFFKNRNNSFKESLLLKDGDLLLMHPECQRNWLHCLPSRKKIKELRINLTFRCYK
ncbi:MULTISPECIES: alpha-ketoglutarate-dependent dioxygenase AlkB family protein [Prochlorococcus]|uniref:alpha-ketoglutarate-dependent dioxygenase AlkB family protein n=1 Tax=Prochlorococcus TaxID=1218 RepID=UPI00053391A5|nr:MULTISPECIES: alpha-ketoglutarate-dependent dioxygenase AlkB [Prochlorococcus]KGG12586.1 Alkylated DNA repair protein AlkB [Prochlorococcus sp. MIT 0601]